MARKIIAVNKKSYFSDINILIKLLNSEGN